MISYLGCPYLHTHSHIQDERYDKVTAVAARLMAEGQFIYSPITSMHHLSKTHIDILPNGCDFWLQHDLAILARCDKLIVLLLEGWEHSNGLRREIEFAAENNIPVEYMEA